tara:strand:+ start:2379 stop:2726 length:348 start_codon:yes stop_codon:yes gene_type:complete
MEDFKSNTSIEERRVQSISIMKKHPDRIPVYVYKHQKSKYDDIKKHKFLVPFDITVGSFIYIIRKQMSLKSDQCIFVFIGGILPPTSSLMSQVYKEHADEDGFLYVAFSHESVFG